MPRERQRRTVAFSVLAVSSSLVAIELDQRLVELHPEIVEAGAVGATVGLDQADDDVLDLIPVAGAAGLAAAVAGAQVLHGAGALGQGLAHQMGVAGKGETGVRGRSLGLSLVRCSRGLGLSGFGGKGAGAGGLGQPHADLGQARQHLALLQRAAAAIGLNVEVGRDLLHRTYHELNAG
jgi:hypothetical protein